MFEPFVILSVIIGVYGLVYLHEEKERKGRNE